MLEKCSSLSFLLNKTKVIKDLGLLELRTFNCWTCLKLMYKPNLRRTIFLCVTISLCPDNTDGACAYVYGMVSLNMPKTK